jgi:hypothetical protein
MTQYSNWTTNSTNTTWKHKSNPKVIVSIVKTYRGYNIYHSHPAPYNTAIMQEPEGAMTMKSARERAEKHLRHWTLSENWTKDKDFGKMGKRAT